MGRGVPLLRRLGGGGGRAPVPARCRESAPRAPLPGQHGLRRVDLRLQVRGLQELPAEDESVHSLAAKTARQTRLADSSR